MNNRNLVHPRPAVHALDQVHEFGVDGAPEGVYTTNMIYSPIHKVRAEVVVQCGDMPLVAAAFDCAVNGLVHTAAV